MRKVNALILGFILVQVFNHTSIAQQKAPFYNEIEAFKKLDSINPPAAGAILFVGSSSFRGWTNVQEYFPEFKIINRGFGGSSLPHVIQYAPDIIFPYKPRQILIYCGENDFTYAEVSAEIVYERFIELFGLIRNKLPKTQIDFVSLKPSPSRVKYIPEMIRANSMIRSFIKKQRRSAYIDVYSRMLLADGSPMPDIFKADKLHMNEKGYAIWQKAIRPYLKK